MSRARRSNTAVYADVVGPMTLTMYDVDQRATQTIPLRVFETDLDEHSHTPAPGKTAIAVKGLRARQWTIFRFPDEGVDYGIVENGTVLWDSRNCTAPSEEYPHSPDALAAPDADDEWATFWDDPPVHEAANLLPMMGDTELDELARDIEANGLLEAIGVWEDVDAANRRYLLDGRNRLAALRRLGITEPRNAPTGPGGPADSVDIVTGVDPAAYILSRNVKRRHLTSEQKRQALSAYLKADPQASDRKVAKDLGVDHKTAGKVRDELESRGEIPRTENRTHTTGRQQSASKPAPKPKPSKDPPNARERNLTPPEIHALRLGQLTFRLESLGKDAREFGNGFDLSPKEARRLLERIKPAMSSIHLLHQRIGEIANKGHA
jgi:hypothetical protein